MSRVDPLAHGLLFERFVNSLRDDLPDIDIDIDSSRRGEVFQWLFEHYRGRAAFVSSHKFFGARSALYETARAFGFNPEEAHALTRPLPMFAEPAELAGCGRPGDWRRAWRRRSTRRPRCSTGCSRSFRCTWAAWFSQPGHRPRPCP